MVGTDRWPSLLPRRCPSLSARPASHPTKCFFSIYEMVSRSIEKENARTRDAPRFSETIGKLLQLGTNLFRHFQMLPHCLGGSVGETFHLRIAPVFCLFFKFRQIFFMIFHHRIHISLVRLLFASFL